MNFCPLKNANLYYATALIGWVLPILFGIKTNTDYVCGFLLLYIIENLREK